MGISANTKSSGRLPLGSSKIIRTFIFAKCPLAKNDNSSPTEMVRASASFCPTHTSFSLPIQSYQFASSSSENFRLSCASVGRLPNASKSSPINRSCFLASVSSSHCRDRTLDHRDQCQSGSVPSFCSFARSCSRNLCTGDSIRKSLCPETAWLKSPKFADAARLAWRIPLNAPTPTATIPSRSK